MSKITYIIKRGSFWQDGEQRHANHANKDLRTVVLEPADRDAMDPGHTDLQSGEEAELEAKKLKVEAQLAEKRAAALAKIDADHAAEIKAKSEKKEGAK